MKRYKRGKFLFGSLLVFTFAMILLLYAKQEHSKQENAKQENGLENINDIWGWAKAILIEPLQL